MSAVGPGDLLEFVSWGFGPRRGDLGTCEAVFEGPPDAGCTAGCDSRTVLVIREWPTPPDMLGWCRCSWAPVSRRSDFEKTLESLRTSAHDLAPLNEPVRA
jgi:hypothetical protein